jgi:dTDP-glucose 4,6-dehydratase
VVQTICEILDELQPHSPFTPHGSLIRFVADRPGHDRRYDINSAKIRQKLGWQPRHTLASGLASTVEWYLSHPEWVQAVRQQQDYQGWIAQNYDYRTQN